MTERGNEIRFYGVRPNKPLLRRIQRQLEKWTCRQISSLSPQEEAAYQVSFEPEAGGCLCCSVQVQVGPEKWIGQDVGKSAQDALFNALQRLSKNLIKTSAQSSTAIQRAVS
jgi:hypothetical protein